MDDDCEILNSTENDEDPLVAEVDVFLSRVFADQLYLFQYPLVPRESKIDEKCQVVGSRLKAKNKLVELDIEIDRKSENFDENREKLAAANLNGEKSQSSSDVQIERLKFSSSNATNGENFKRFAVGLSTPVGIKLSPVNAIFQIRPNFDLTSSSIVQTKDSTDDELEQNEQEKSYSLVTMKFLRSEGRLEREKKLRSYNYLDRARQEERWIDFSYFSQVQRESIDLQNLWRFHETSNLRRFPIRWRQTISIDQYLRLLFNLPGQEQIFIKNTVVESNVVNEQKPIALPTIKTKKNNKTNKEKSKKARTCNQLPTATGETKTEQKTISTNVTPLSSISVPQTIVKADPETIQNELLSFMKRRFGYRPYFKLSEINTAIKLDLISSPPGHPLASGVTEASILRAAAEIGALFVNKKWPKNLKQEPVFINTQMGDKYDILRRYVADLLERSDGFQFSDLRSRIKQENQSQNFPVVELKKFVKDHFITRSSRKGVLYCVKGTAVK